MASRQPVDAREEASIARFLVELERLPAPFDETADPTHITASAIVISSAGVLLHRHKRLGLWMQPGGHVDGDEQPERAAVREVAEETGLRPLPADATPALVHVDVHPGGRGHLHLDLRYLVVTAPLEPQPSADESQAVRWFSWDEALAIADAGLRGALVALRPGSPA